MTPEQAALRKQQSPELALGIATPVSSQMTEELRFFLHERQLNLGDVTSNQGGREFFAPVFAAFVVAKAAETQVPASTASETQQDFALDTILNRLQVVHIIRKANLVHFRELEADYFKSPATLEKRSGTLRIARLLMQELGDNESADVAKDVVIAIGGLARNAAKRDLSAGHDEIARSSTENDSA